MIWSFVRWILIALGTFSAYYMVSFEIKYNGITTKFFKEYLHPELHKNSLSIYMKMLNTLLDTKDMAAANIRKVKVQDSVSNADLEESMSSIAIETGLREVGSMALSEQVEAQLGKKQRLLKIYQYCSPIAAMTMADYSDAFSAYLPCRIALIEAHDGTRWLYTLDMDFIIYGGKPLPTDLYKLATGIKKSIYAIQDRAAEGDF